MRRQNKGYALSNKQEEINVFTRVWMEKRRVYENLLTSSYVDGSPEVYSSRYAHKRLVVVLASRAGQVVLHAESSTARY